MSYIFIHGLGQDSSSWKGTLEFLSEQDGTYCPDLAVLLEGIDVTYQNLYEKFSEYCNHFSKPLNICGISMGAVLALNYALDNPQKVDSLVLIAPQYKIPKTLLKIQNIIFKFMPQSSFKSMGFGKKDFITLTNSMITLDFSNRLSDISCHVLIICGEKDSANIKAAKELSERISMAKFEIIVGSGHEANIDKPKELAEKLSYFSCGNSKMK